jgi:phosphonate transport system substrate-binding protein
MSNVFRLMSIVRTLRTIGLFLLGLWVGTAGAEPAIRIGLTPVIAHDQYALTADLRRYFESRLGRPVELTWRDSYRQTIDLMARGKLDFAWVSVYPYAYLQRHHGVRLLATPLTEGRPFFRAYLIVPAGDKTTHSLLQLEGKFFAYADPYSHSGYLVPRYELRMAGKDPARFFAKTFFTLGHSKVIRAVASGLADGGYVDGFIWETLAQREPTLTNKTRVVKMSEEFGFPPVVAAKSVNEATFQAMRQVLLTMAEDPEGKKLLKRMNLNGFVAGDPAWYAEVHRMMQAMGEP